MAVIRRKTGPRFDVQALLAPLQELFKFQMQQQAQEASQKRQYDLQARNQAESDRRSRQQKLLDEGKTNPSALFAAGETGELADRPNWQAFAPSNREATDIAGGKIAGAKSLAELPSEQDIPGMLRQAAGRSDITNPVNRQGVLTTPQNGELPSRPWETKRAPSIEELLAQRAAGANKFEQMRRNEPATNKFVKPSGEEFTEETTRGALEDAGPQLTKIGAVQAAQNAAAGEDIARAGKARTAGAETAARLAAETDPDYLKKKLAYEQQLEDIRHKDDLTKAGETEQVRLNVQYRQNVGNALISAEQALNNIAALSPKVNTAGIAELSSPASWLNFIKRPAEAASGNRYLGWNDDAIQLAANVDSVAALFANNPVFGGNVGATSENDRLVIARQLPLPGTPSVVAQRLVADFKKKLAGAEQLMRDMPVTATPAERQQIFRKAMGLSAAGSPGGVPQNRVTGDIAVEVAQ